jgi:Protein of unknown function (DUF1566)
VGLSARVSTHDPHTLLVQLSAMRDDALAIWMVPKPLDVEGIGRLLFASACPTKECQRFQGIPHQGGLTKMKRAVVGITSAALATLLMAGGAMGQCCGDCNGDGQVTIDEILKVVNRALNSCQDDGVCTASIATCSTQLTQCQGALATCQSQSSGQRFPATGQTTCWDTNGKVIACSGTGQDGQIQAGGALAYVDNGDGTITDLNTHLMWEKKSADGSIHDQSKPYAWADAFSTFIGGLNAGGGFAGHTDWRLPNVKELLSIVNYQNFIPAVSAAFNANCAPGCTVTTCSCTQSDGYWSATTGAGNPGYAWSVDFYSGDVGGPNKPSDGYVRAVRSGL